MLLYHVSLFATWKQRGMHFLVSSVILHSSFCLYRNVNKTRTWYICTFLFFNVCYFCGYPFQRPEHIKHRTKRSTSAINFCISSLQRVFGCF
ncbi:hypothetical protein Hanom_Chr09g00762191 [Helianthus anomalus]